jgi:hypothetical protein
MGLGQRGTLAFFVVEEGLGLRETAFCASKFRYFYLFWIPFVGLLGDVCVTGCSAAGLYCGDIDVVGWREHGRVFRYLVIVKREFLIGLKEGVEREGGDGSMVAVTVDGPLGEDCVGGFDGEQAGEGFVVGLVDDGSAVDLAGEDGAGFQDLAGLLSFGGADGGAAVQWRATAEAFAAVQIEKNDIVAEVGVAGDGAGAAAFGVAWMAAGEDDFQGRCGAKH